MPCSPMPRFGSRRVQPVKRCAPAIVLAGLAVGLAGCGGSSGQTVHVISDNAAVKVLDLGAKGKSAGDDYVFDGALRDSHGQQVGHVYGTQTSIALTSDAEIVQTLITFHFSGNDSITIGGISRYPKGDVGLISGASYDRPILGGTGKYADARGELETVRLPDGRYDQTFHLHG